ncbi:cytochrome C biogenesis protein [Roseateles aquatilis]|uniref:Cytochrome C biogenesis protein n=1 Tax=Roseateles aquatilis TaxID=431061 RepID=A0A2D0AM50_9BURK|nr:sugar ABC transporter permease [Roseateles aquatilis]OWQ85303.1 cytochrome C biogenesis protein [Roseateles aquatilis]
MSRFPRPGLASPGPARPEAANAGPARSGLPRPPWWRSRAWAPYLFIAPFFALFVVFGLFPLLFSIWLSLQQWNPAEGLHTMHWVGLENYVYALTDPWFHDALYNTAWFALVAGVPQHLVALPLAFFIHRRAGRGRDLIVGAYFVPYITSSVAIALIFNTLYSKDYGLINAALAELTRIPFLGSPLATLPSLKDGGIDWLGDADYTRPAVAFVVFWRYLGWNVVLYLSGLQIIDKDLYEAATLDGASEWQQFRHVTLPLLKPIMFFAVTLTIIGNLQLFEEPFILVDGEQGVATSVMTSAIFMYRTAFSDGDFGTASAMSWLMFLLIAALTWLNARLFGRDARGGHGAP